MLSCVSEPRRSFTLPDSKQKCLGLSRSCGTVTSSLTFAVAGNVLRCMQHPHREHARGILHPGVAALVPRTLPRATKPGRPKGLPHYSHSIGSCRTVVLTQGVFNCDESSHKQLCVGKADMRCGSGVNGQLHTAACESASASSLLSPPL